MGSARVVHGDCLDVMRGMPDASVHAVVTDPPYGLGFMGKEWDDLPPGREWAEECLRVLKPGGYLLAFGGTRTFHRLACAVEDGGFEIRDSIAWLYGSGFPKSLDVGKAIDKAAGVEREGTRTFSIERGHEDGVAGWVHQRCDGCGKFRGSQAANCHCPDTAPATAAARDWAGWGTALKPAFEPVVVARKPLVGTVAGNVQAWGTGALNIDACRVPHGSDVDLDARQRQQVGVDNGWRMGKAKLGTDIPMYKPGGRWPANVALDGSQADALDQQAPDVGGGLKRGYEYPNEGNILVRAMSQLHPGNTYGDTGGASRFFPTFRYQAKAPTTERPTYVTADGRKVSHPTVKPLGLMRWLVRLVTPPGGTVLDPFAGSGATLEACIIEGFPCIAIERDAESLPLIQVRIDRQAGTLPFEDVS